MVNDGWFGVEPRRMGLRITLLPSFAAAPVRLVSNMRRGQAAQREECHGSADRADRRRACGQRRGAPGGQVAGAGVIAMLLLPLVIFKKTLVRRFGAAGAAPALSRYDVSSKTPPIRDGVSAPAEAV